MSLKPDPNIGLRDARLDEAPLVLDVWRAAYNEDDLHGELEDVRRIIADGTHARLLVAEVDGAMVGTLIATFDGWRGNMYRLAVMPRPPASRNRPSVGERS